ncbi:MAG: selenide, water dikinase SelD [Bacteroidota bacterium]
MSETLRLTSFSKGSGCGCKIHPAALEEMLHGVDFGHHPNLLVGNEFRDDASVMDISNDQLLIQTTDFFTPTVDDPVAFGQIAAANAISDVYAMGGKPLMANALLGWPEEHIPAAVAREVIQAAAKQCMLAGIPLAGGHSISISEPVFGLSVTGLVQRTHLKTNRGARPGDLIGICKPLGSGILAAAHKRGQLQEPAYAELIQLTTRLNMEGMKLGAIAGVHAMTDVTGFGLLGHLMELCRGSALGAVVRWPDVPVAAHARALAAMMIMPDNTFRNWNALETEVQLETTDPLAFAVLNDPQTNGGLLLSVAPEARNAVEEAVPHCAWIGEFTAEASGIRVHD